MHIHTIQLNIEKVLGGCVHMDATEFGAYMSLMITCYQAKNSLPNDDARLARMARVSPKVWKRIKPTIAEKFTKNDFHWSHDVVQGELESYASLSTKNKANRLKGKQKDSPVVNNSSNQSVTNTNNKDQITIKKYNKKDFDLFFKEYPKQIDQVDAEDAFAQQVEEGNDPEVIINATKLYAVEQQGNDKKYIKSPVKFLDNQVFLEPEYNKPPSKPLDTSKWTPWQITLGKIIGLPQVNSWFSKAVLQDGVLIVDTRFIHDHIKNNYHKEIKAIGIREIETRK